MTTLIASQNLRELEDFCDHVGLLHEAGCSSLKTRQAPTRSFQAQIAFREDVTAEQLKSAGLEILRFSARGSLSEILSRNTGRLHTILNQMISAA